MAPARPSREPPPDSTFPKSEPPSGALASEDFLYHLYRGSELLQDDRVELAKDELERALRLQPRDVEGQGLLGIVYFRLGLYPRAIDIYERITRIVPHEITPKINLALCYLKTGQLSQARETLEDVLAREPEHKRAWAYLGLIFQRQAEYGKARVAFDNAGQTSMADRMLKLEEHEQQGADRARDDHPQELRKAAEGAFQELEYGNDPFAVAESNHGPSSSSGRWEAIELGEETLPQAARLPPLGPASLPEAEQTGTSRESGGPDFLALPVSLGSFVQSRGLLRPIGRQATLVDESTVHVLLVHPFAIRANSVRAVSVSRNAWNEARLLRRNRARDFDEPLGGSNDPIVSVDGEGELMARALNQRLALIELNDDHLTIKEEALMGFDAQLRYDWTRLELSGSVALSMLELSGTGLVVLRWAAPPRAMTVSEHCSLVHSDVLAGWTGRVVPKSVDAAESPGKLRGFVGFSGEGQVFVF
jgi:hypothetical protein